MESLLNTARPARGFTLVEMLVVLSIIGIVTTIALVGQSGFNRSLFLTDAAYSVALSIREMQSLGLSSRKYQAGATIIQNAGYGFYVTTSATDRYTLYADIQRTVTPPSNCLTGTSGTPDAKPGDCVYVSGSDGIVQTYQFGRGFRVSQFCGWTIAASPQRLCSTDSSQALTQLSLTFLRSSTETMASARRSGSSSWTPLNNLEIYIRSADSTATRGICISKVGQVSVVQGTCP